MTDAAWKQLERDVVPMLGTKRRTPLSGGNSGHTRADNIDDELFVECKQGKRIGICKLYYETRALARKEGKVPVIISKEKGRHGFLVTCHITDLPKIAERHAEAMQDYAAGVSE